MQDAEADPPPRLASATAPGYAEGRAAMLCDFAAFSVQYAPSVSLAFLEQPDRPRLVIAVPIGFHG
eukprot:755970-Prymnesium_polylepis.1